MVLLVDIGNSSIYFGLFEDKIIKKSFRVKSFTDKTSDEYYQLIFPFLKDYDVEDVIISSVVPVLTSTLKKLFKEYFKLKALIIGPGIKNGVGINVDDPKSVGADLICDTAYVTNNEPTLIVDLGTATKYLYIKNKTLHGVVIAPGVTTSLKALIKSTALLPNIELQAPNKVLGKNTVSCMQSGIIYGTASQIDSMIERIKEEVEVENLNVVATGGLAKLIVPYCKNEILVDEELLLKGIMNIYNLNRK